MRRRTPAGFLRRLVAPSSRSLCASLLVVATAAWHGAATGEADPATATLPGRNDPSLFRDGTAASGLDRWSSAYGPPTDKETILETMGAGVALTDLDGDGTLDVYLVTGRRRSSRHIGTRDDGPSSPDPHPGNALFRGRGDGTYAPTPGWSGVRLRGWYYGVAAADYDNDGFDDLLVTAYGPDRLLRNNGDGSFTEVDDSATIGLPGWSAGAAWGDVNGDGWVDLFVAGYVTVDPAEVASPGARPTCTWKKIAVPCGPRGLPGAPSGLFLNRGDGSFERVQRELLDSRDYFGLGAVWGDYDGDGDSDLYVANDQTPNRLFRNDEGALTDLGELSGAAFSEDGRPEAGMGTDWGDADGDGRLDLFVTNFADESNTLYLNSGDDFFVDSTYAARLGIPSFRYLSWGTSFQDLDADGDEDLFVASGHVYPQVDTEDLVDPYPQRNQLFLNVDGSYVEEKPSGEDGLTAVQVSRGAAFGDADDDGDVDVLVATLDGPPQLLLNRMPQGRHVTVHLVGRRANRSAVGARVTVGLPDGTTRVDEVEAGHSYLSQSSLALHFGLGDAPTARVEVRWPGPDGGREGPWEVAADSQVLIRQGSPPMVIDSP